MQENFMLISLKIHPAVHEEKAYQIFSMSAIKNTCVSDQNFYIKRLMIKDRFLLFQVCHNFANLFFKLSVSTFYKEIS